MIWRMGRSPSEAEVMRGIKVLAAAPRHQRRLNFHPPTIPSPFLFCWSCRSFSLLSPPSSSLTLFWSLRLLSALLQADVLREASIRRFTRSSPLNSTSKVGPPTKIPPSLPFPITALIHFPALYLQSPQWGGGHIDLRKRPSSSLSSVSPSAPPPDSGVLLL